MCVHIRGYIAVRFVVYVSVIMLRNFTVTASYQHRTTIVQNTVL